MKILSRLMSHFGYVRLKDYGYELTPSGRIVEVVKVEDDRFAPPPWQPVALPSAVSLLPPMKQPPVPRPLAPAPVSAEEAEPAPLFRVPGALATVETAPPGEEADDDAISIDEAPEEEEWEWKMALARAREAAEKDKKDRDKAKAERMAARRGESSSFPTNALPLAAPPSRTTRVVDSPKPMSKIARPEPKPAPEPRKAPEPTSRIARVEPRAATGQPVASRTPRTVPPKAPPGRKSNQLTAVAAASRPEPAAASAPSPAPAAPKSPVRASIEKSVSRVFSPPTPSGKARPLPRLARGTESPVQSGRPTQPRLALGSGRLPAVRDPSADVTATDITAVDRAQASMREDEDTRVNVAVVPPSADITLDIAADADPAEVENTTVDPQAGRIGVVAVTEGSPLPRLTARLRRQSVPN